MAAVAHSKEFASKVGIPQKVGREFNAADRGKARMMARKAYKKK